jgi:hypothetical protein
MRTLGEQRAFGPTNMIQLLTVFFKSAFETSLLVPPLHNLNPTPTNLASRTRFSLRHGSSRFSLRTKWRFE